MKKDSARHKLLLGLAVIMILAGCGLKANPVAPMSVAAGSDAQQILIASIDKNAVALTWRMKRPDGRIRYVEIEKSQLGSPGNTCRDCPRVFDKIGQLTVHDAKKEEYRFMDHSVEAGKIYSYRLRLCEETGACRESSTVEIDFK